jgi:glucose-1-phosphate cytidylyltransferase
MYRTAIDLDAPRAAGFRLAIIGPMEDVVILCGGRGTRLQEHSRSIPKPLVEIGGKPIVWHVMRIYAAQGLRRFTLCTGYRGEAIEESVRSHAWPQGVEVRCVDTGLDTPTGGRLARVGPLLAGRPFLATYADGVADIDLGRLIAFHRAHGDLATMTVVRPRLPFGVADVDGDGRVASFREKPYSEQWINGGFFCLEPGVLAHLGEDSVLEREPLEGLASAGQLHAFRHDGFWDCMDTYKDALLLNDLWSRGAAPWKIWNDEFDPTR